MRKISRRDFLLKVAVGAGAVTLQQFLAACNTATPTLPPTLIPTQTRLIPSQTPAPTTAATPAATSTAAPSATPLPQPTPTPLPADMVVARNGEPGEMVRQAIAALGGMEKFVKKGAKVIIKPNICVAYHTFEYAATTNPWVVAELVKLCFAAGAASVRVMDQPFGGTAEAAYAKSGIAEQVKAAGGEMVIMSGFKYVVANIPKGKDLKATTLYDEILKADTLINVPIAKHHSLARLTMGMKNLMGVIDDRPGIHRNLGQRLADITSLIKPTLTVIDAVRILMANGPTGGNLADVKKMNTIIITPDIVAADTYGASLFGVKPADLPYIAAGAAMGLGRKDIDQIRIREIVVGA